MDSELKSQLEDYWKLRTALANREVGGEDVAASEWEELDDRAHQIVGLMSRL